MATATLNVSTNTVGAVSEYTAYESGPSGNRVIKYTTPSVDGGEVIITVPSGLANCVFNSAQLTYTVSSDSGTRTVKYSSTATDVTNANLLEKLQNGDTEIRIYFNFRATASGPIGHYTKYCTWSNITVTVDYIPAGLISGTLTSTQGSTLSYVINDRSIAIGETIPIQLTVRPVSDVTSISFRLADSAHTSSGYTENIIQVNAPAGTNTTITANIGIDDCTLASNIQAAYVSAVFVYVDSTETTAWSATALNLVGVRVAPTISETWTDTTSLYSTFGSYIQNQSLMSCSISVAVDTSADSSTYITSRKLTINNTEYTSGDGTFSVGAIDRSGTVSYLIQVTDNFGVIGSKSGSLSFLAYSQPALTTLNIQRYNVSTSELDDTSDRVCVTIAGSVPSINSANAWTAVALYTNGITTGMANMLSGSDGSSFSRTQDASLLQATLSNSYNWTITVTLTDQISSVSYETIVSKTGAIFNVEVNGVSVGMRSSGTQATPKFESDYEAHFYNEANFHDDVLFAANKTVSVASDVSFSGETSFSDDITVEAEVKSSNGITVSADVQFTGTITDANGNVIGVQTDSGWQSITLDNGTQHADYAPCGVRKIGNMVYVRGVITPNTAIPSSGSTATLVATLPAGYRPPYNMIMNGAGIPQATSLEIDADGSVKVWNRVGASLGTSERISLTSFFFTD